ncbi:probable F-box protein At2g36090 [Magnolia sinica]|uniref:probable F-box protein At2g36090 n=1 Tax=Magnolia sinica TaxID=86752 RepID=UPI00265A92C0|nr:probable F-box protein At2g36090 [Magnolia sinica]
MAPINASVSSVYSLYKLFTRTYICFPSLPVVRPIFMASPSSATVSGVGLTTISALPADILTHILQLLDGPTLASVSCASSHLHALSSDPRLWHNLCRSMWPSSDHPRVSHLISTAFSDAHHSFFSDSFPLLPLHPLSPRVPHPLHHLISAVDLHHCGIPVFSKVLETETRTGWFFSSPFRIDALDRKDPPPPPPPGEISGETLAADLTLSWILIDPSGGRAANLSSLRPVSVQRHWLSGEIQARFATVLIAEPEGEWITCGVLVTCGECGEVREVSMQVEDMDGMSLNGRDSLVILQRAMEGGRATKEREIERMRERYGEYVRRKREKKEKKLRREGRLDLACVLLGVHVFSSFLWFVFFR